MNKIEEVQNMYKTLTENVRPAFGDNLKEAESYYLPYLTYLNQNIKNKSDKILEIGCGPGWGVYFLRQMGFNATGIDLPQEKPEATKYDKNLPYIQGAAESMPFADASFDVITMHAVLEHVPNPEKVLSEIKRVLRPGGRFICVGPNLLGAGLTLYWFFKHSWLTLKKGRLIDKRKPDMPRHPGGNTVFEVAVAVIHHLFYTIKKLLFEKTPKFLMREPDHRPPFHADNDACYYANPMDLLNWAKQNNFKPIIWWGTHKKLTRYLWPLVGGTWVVIEKVNE